MNTHLIRLHWWFGPHKMATPEQREHYSKYEESGTATYATALPLGEALERIKLYEQARNARPNGTGSKIEYTLDSITPLTDCTLEQLTALNLGTIEDMPQTPEEV